MLVAFVILAVVATALCRLFSGALANVSAADEYSRAVLVAESALASAAIAQDALLEPAANGRVATLGGGAGTHHVVGRALNAAGAAGDLIEMAPSYFLRVI